MASEPNLKILTRPTFVIDPATDTERRLKLEYGEPTFDIFIRVEGTLDVNAGVAGDQVVRPEAVQRLFDVELRKVGKSNETLIRRMSLRELLMFHGMNVSTFPTVTQPTQATLNAQNPTGFDMMLRLWGSPRFLFQPHEIYWPAWDGVQAPRATALELVFYPNTTSVNAASDAGTDAFLSAGGDTIVFSDGPNITVEQHIAPGHEAGVNGKPRWYPVYRSRRTETFDAADTRHEEEVNFEHRIASLLLRHEEGSDRDAVDFDTGRWNDLSILATDWEKYDERPLALLEEEATQLFDAYTGGGAGDDFDGYLPIRLAPGGRGNSAWNPKDFTRARLEFDVDAPATNPGAFTGLYQMLKTL